MAGFAVGRWTRVAVVGMSASFSTSIRIAVMSDFHVGASGFGVTQAQRCVRLAMAQRPDVIVLVGDFVNGRAGIPHLATALHGVQAPLGVYAVLGNHDHWADANRVTEALRSVGIRVLVNESVLLHKGGKRWALVGIDDLWAGKPDWHDAFAKVPKCVPIVLLSHNPDAALHPMRRRTTLILAGHTHGGQIWLPSLMRRALRRWTARKLIPATEYGWRYPHGFRRVGTTWVYVTSGVTQGRSPPRWFTRPEVAIVEMDKISSGQK